MASSKVVVNLDALIARADLAAPGGPSDEIASLTLVGLEPKGMLYPWLRKPDFQRETSNWTPLQVADLVATFVKRELIPALILWRSGQQVFVVDGAHRLSALIAWVHDDYGDGTESRKYFQGIIPPEQERAAIRTRELIKASIGSYQDHKIASEHPANFSSDLVDRASRLAWHPLPVQWIRDSEHDKAEKAFFRINQGGTKIDSTEHRILIARRSASALAARAVLRAGTGHDYWAGFSDDVGARVEHLGGEIYRLLFLPTLHQPIKSLDIPVAGQGYGPKVLSFVFDLVNLVNKVQIKDSSYKFVSDKSELPEDPDGSQTIKYLEAVRAICKRICSNDSSSLGLHPGVYFYSKNGIFQQQAFLTYAVLFADWSTADFNKFTKVRADFEDFIIRNSGVSDAISKLGTGARSRPRLATFYRTLVSLFSEGKIYDDVVKALSATSDLSFFVSDPLPTELFDEVGSSFPTTIKGAAFIKDALPSAHKCPTCKGLMHVNGMQVGHKKAKRDGGKGVLENSMMQHPFCNSTFAN